MRIEWLAGADRVAECPLCASSGTKREILRIDGQDRPALTLVDCPDCEEPLAGRQDAAEARVLCDDRPASGEIAGGAVAEPAAGQTDVQLLRHCELALRSADEVAVDHRVT